MVRCFVGIMVPESIKEAVMPLQKRLAASDIECKLVEPENMHICLSFLGEVDENKINELEASLDFAASKHKGFDVNVGKIRFVPNENYIRVIVLEATDAGDAIEKLRDDVVKAVGGDSKPSHLTLCRVKYVADKKRFVSEFGGIVIDKPFTVGSIQLIKSELMKSGPVYTVVHESKLS